MKPTLSIMDFIIIAVLLAAVTTGLHFLLTYKEVEVKDATGAVKGSALKPTIGTPKA